MVATLWRGLVFIIAVAIAARCSSGHACSVIPSYEFYEVTGSSEAELEAALRANGPKDETGAVRFAYTDWTVEWQWKRLSDQTIDPDSIKLSCVAKILLPKLKESQGLAPELLDAWDGFVQRTKEHELNHVAHIDKFAPRILILSKQEYAKSGVLTRKRAEAIISQVIAEIRSHDRRYDVRTNHGFTEGTWKIQLKS